MLIAQISDTHLFDPTADHPSVEKRADWLRQCVAAINSDEPDAVIFTGDTVQTASEAEYQYLRELLQPLKSPLYVVPGNRDDNTLLRSVIGELANFVIDSDLFNYVIDSHEVRLIALDSTEAGGRKGVFPDARRDWLDETLAQQPEKATLLFIHHPPFDVGDHYIGGYRDAADAIGLRNIVMRHSQVRALVCGHVHHPVQQEWAGTRAVIMPSVAVDLRKGVDESVALERPLYWLHRVAQNETFRSELRSVSPI